MRLLLGILIAFVVATVVGLGTTWLTVTRGAPFGALTIGAWTAWPRNGTSDIDPYARAAVARTGELPTGSGDGIAFLARTDDSGQALDGRCDITISGVTPPARYWTITLYDPAGQLIANTAGRYGFSSQEIVRATDGSFEILASARPRPGNWLPTGGAERYLLMFRLYDTPVGVTTRAGRDAPMPAITRKACT